MMLILSSAFVFAIAKIRFISLIYNFLHIILLKKKHCDGLRGSIITHLRKFVSSVPEYRITSRGNFKHKLEDILMLVIFCLLYTSKKFLWLFNYEYFPNLCVAKIKDSYISSCLLYTSKRPRALSTKMTDALLSFMRTGSPNCASLPEWRCV